MTVLQINAVYAKSSTGRTTREMHEYFLANGIESYVAAPDLAGLSERCHKIGGVLDHKIHALVNRITGKQAYASHVPTMKLLKWVDGIKPDVVILRNLHGNYINLPMLTRYLASNDIATILVLHDSWFVTGGCTYYIAPGCSKWKESCGACPALKNDICSWGIDATKEVLHDRRKLLGSIPRLSIIGVSQWVADDAKESIIGKDAFCVKCIYNWIDLNTFRPKDRAELKVKYGFKPDQFIVLGVSATWSEAKGIRVFHELADILSPEQQIVLVGNSEALENKPLNITYLPATDNLVQLADMYAMADVYVNPTVQETFGKTTAEALSCGTPVVAYNGTATPELIGRDGQCGYLLDGLDAKDYADKILEIFHGGVDLYSINCRARADSMFNMQTNLKEYLKLFDLFANCLHKQENNE